LIYRLLEYRTVLYQHRARTGLTGGNEGRDKRGKGDVQHLPGCVAWGSCKWRRRQGTKEGKGVEGRGACASLEQTSSQLPYHTSALSFIISHYLQTLPSSRKSIQIKSFQLIQGPLQQPSRSGNTIFVPNSPSLDPGRGRHCSALSCLYSSIKPSHVMHVVQNPVRVLGLMFRSCRTCGILALGS